LPGGGKILPRARIRRQANGAGDVRMVRTPARSQDVFSTAVMGMARGGAALSRKDRDPGERRDRSKTPQCCSGRPSGCRYSWMRVARKPRTPWFSMSRCHDKNSSIDKEYRLQASSSVSRPERTPATTSAFRRITQRLVLVGGRSASVIGRPMPLSILPDRRPWGFVIRLLPTACQQKFQLHAV